MIKRKAIVVYSIALTIFSLGFCTSAFCRVLYVNSEVEVSGTGTSWSTAIKDLRTAVELSTGVDEIWVREGSYKVSESPLLVNKFVKIYGGFPPKDVNIEPDMDDRDWETYETTIEPLNVNNPPSHLLEIRWRSATIDGFQINNGGNLSNDGGGIWILGCAPTIKNCVFNGNKAIAGGAIAIFSSSPNIKQCIFKNNLADYGGAIANINSSPRITNCFFQTNIADEGGAISNMGNSHPSCKESTFSYNRALHGGAVYSSGTYGGTYDKCIFENNGFSGENDNDLSVEGGAFFFDEAEMNHQPLVHLVRCQFQNNKAKRGGAVYLNEHSFAPTSEIKECIFTDNRAEIEGGAIFQKGDIPIVNCDFLANCAGFLNGPPFEPYNLGSDNKGGALASNGNYHIVKNCRFAGNWAFYGGAISAENGYSAYFTNSTFRNNHAFRGGAISVSRQDQVGFMPLNTRIMNCFFSFNQAEEDGGALYADSIRANILHCTFFGNSCKYYGGAFRYAYSDSPFETVHIDNSIFWGNRSQTEWLSCEKEISTHEGATFYVEYSNIDHDESACDGLNPFLDFEGNIQQDPLFTTSGNFHLRSDSPCIDAGDIDKIYWSEPILGTVYQLEYDLDGDLRVANENPDMGVDEFSVQVDILPGICPNIIDPETTNILQVALLGSEYIAAELVAPKSVKLIYQGEEIALNPTYKISDVGQPVRERSDVCDCPAKGRDGFKDLILIFDIEKLTAFSNELIRPKKVVLSVQGEFTNGMPFTAMDCLSFMTKRKHK